MDSALNGMLQTHETACRVESGFPEMEVRFEKSAPTICLIFWVFAAIISFALFGGQWSLPVLFAAGLVFAFGPFWIYRIIDDRVKVAINVDGIEDRRTGMSVSWSDVDRLVCKVNEEGGVRTAECVYIQLHDGQTITLPLNRLDANVESVRDTIEFGIVTS